MANEIKLAPTPSAPNMGGGCDIPYQRVITTINQPVGPEPANLTCPACAHSIRTTVVRKCKSNAHVAACLMCLFCCWCCFCIPYCLNSFKNINHYCPNCKVFIGAYQH